MSQQTKERDHAEDRGNTVSSGQGASSTATTDDLSSGHPKRRSGPCSLSSSQNGREPRLSHRHGHPNPPFPASIPRGSWTSPDLQRSVAGVLGTESNHRNATRFDSGVCFVKRLRRSEQRVDRRSDRHPDDRYRVCKARADLGCSFVWSSRTRPEGVARGLRRLQTCRFIPGLRFAPCSSTSVSLPFTCSPAWRSWIRRY
jgi:hypothetical protein